MALGHNNKFLLIKFLVEKKVVKSHLSHPCVFILLLVFLSAVGVIYIKCIERTKAAPAVVQEPRLFNVAQDFLDAPLVCPPVAARFVAEVGGRRAVGVRDGIGVATGGLGICHRLGNLEEEREDLKTSH